MNTSIRVLGAILSVAIIAFLAQTTWARHVYEDVAIAFDPNAERIYAYANRHFDSKNATAYDLVRARELYYRVLREDQNHPTAYHQLARIEFLYGNYPIAMARIDEQIRRHGDALPNAYYVRGLIEGFMGDYDAAIVDYAKYLETDPMNWAALNDFAWVLLKANQPAMALRAADNGLKFFPDNVWLLNSQAIALYELGRYDEALFAAERAASMIDTVTREAWLTAYPGNDARVADAGIQTLKTSIQKNIHSINEKVVTNRIQ